MARPQQALVPQICTRGFPFVVSKSSSELMSWTRLAQNLREWGGAELRLLWSVLLG